MPQQRKTRKRSGPPDPRPAETPASHRQSRWPLVVLAVVGLAGSVPIVERLTRPLDPPAPPQSPVTEPGGPSADLILPPPVQLTHAEVVAEAAGLADELATSFPEEPKALSLSGRLEYMFRRPENAIQRWDRALQLNPQWADAWLGKAELARQQDEFDKAVEYMHRLAEISPKVAREKVFLLADCLLKAGNAQEAIAALEEAGKQTPLPAWARVMLGQGYDQLKDYERSAGHYRKALDDPQQASVARYGLYRALIRLGRTEEAAKYREDYVHAQQKVMDQFDRMQRAGTDEERKDPAQWSPVLAQYHCIAGELYAVRGQKEEAKRHWLRASALAPQRPEPKQLLESLEGP